MQSEETNIRLLGGRHEGGLSTKHSPILTKLGKAKAVDSISGIRIRDIGIELICAHDTQWRFALIVADSVSTNRSCGRHFVSGKWKYRRLLVFAAPRRAQTLSNCVRYSLALSPFPGILRLRCVVNAEPILEFLSFCNRELEQAVITARYMDGNDARLLRITFMAQITGRRARIGRKTTVWEH